MYGIRGSAADEIHTSPEPYFTSAMQDRISVQSMIMDGVSSYQSRSAMYSTPAVGGGTSLMVSEVKPRTRP